MSSVPSVSIRCDDLNEHFKVQQEPHSSINLFIIFENDLERKMYLRQSKNNRIVLIISGQLDFVIIPLNYTVMPINFIHVYYLDLCMHCELASIFIKIQAIDLDLYEMMGEIKMDLKSIEKWFDESLLISMCQSDSNGQRSSINVDENFLPFELFIRGLLRFPCDPANRNKFFDLCRKECQHHHKRLSTIQEFETSYTPEDALLWYTKDMFFSGILNKALRASNMNLIFLSQFFIQDLYKQLAQLQRIQHQIPSYVYRGQPMSKQELDSLEQIKGQFVAMKSFLSTSLDQAVALSFTSDECGDLCPVLFKIHNSSDLSVKAKPFANITSQSHFKHEKEVLYMPGTIFRLVDIRTENKITVIELELCNENHHNDMKCLLERIEMESDKYPEYFILGYVLLAAKMYDEAEQCLNRVLQDLENDHSLIAELWGSIGLVKKAKGEIESSLQWFNKSLKRYEQMEDRAGTAKCLLNLGNVHQMKAHTHRMKEEVNEAIDKYNQALSILQQNPANQYEFIAVCYSNLGAAYAVQQKSSEALEYYKTALCIRKTILTHGHPDIGKAVSDIGNVYSSKNEYYDALRCFEQALDIFNISLPSEHPFIAQTYYNMGLTYFNKGDFRRSLVLLNRVNSIYHNTLSSDHPDARRCADNIDFIKRQYSKELSMT